MTILHTVLSHTLVWKLGWVLIHSLWLAAAVTAALGVALTLLRKASSNVRYLVACGALILMVVLPTATFWMVDAPATRVVSLTDPAMDAPTALPSIGTTEIPLHMRETPPASVMTTETPKVSWSARAITKLEASLPYFVLAWIVGVFGLSLWHLGGWAQLQRLKRQLVEPVADELRGKVNRLSEQLRIRQAVDVVQSALVQVPTVIGWLKPLILLPASAITGLSATQLEALLAHELAHIRRHDYLVNMLQTAIEILGFYHPAVWWTSRCIRIERENCCDDVAAGLAGDSALYADALATMEGLRGHPGLAMAASGGNLFARIRRLAGKEQGRAAQSGWVPAVAGVLLFAAVVAFGARVPSDASSAIAEPAANTNVSQGVALTFRLAERDAADGLTEATVEGSDQTVWLHEKVELSGDHVLSARVGENWQGGPMVEIQFTDQGRARFEQLTRENVMKMVAIIVDGNVLSAPVIREAISGGKAQITGAFDREEAERIAAGLSKQPWSEVVLAVDVGINSTDISTVVSEEFGRMLVAQIHNRSERAARVRTEFYLVAGNEEKKIGDGSIAIEPNASGGSAVPWPMPPGEYPVMVRVFPHEGYRDEDMTDNTATAILTVAAKTEAVAEIPAPLDMAKAEVEVRGRYAAAHPEIQEYVLWTARTFGRSAMWLNDDALAGLSAAQREEKITYLATLLSDSEYGRHLCNGLAEASALKDERLVPGLMKVAGYQRESGNYDCRPKWIAVSALARQESDQAVPLLISLVDHGNQNTRKWARAALARKTGQDFGDDKPAWANWWESQGHTAVDKGLLVKWGEEAAAAVPLDLERMIRAAVANGSETVIEIRKNGSMFIGDRAITIEDIESLGALDGLLEKLPVLIRAHRNARHDAVVGVMEACKKAGVLNISIATQEEEE